MLEIKSMLSRKRTIMIYVIGYLSCLNASITSKNYIFSLKSNFEKMCFQFFLKYIKRSTTSDFIRKFIPHARGCIVKRLITESYKIFKGFY